MKMAAPLLPNTPSVLTDRSCVFQKCLETKLMFVQWEWSDQTRVQCQGAFGKHRPSLWLRLNCVTARLFAVAWLLSKQVIRRRPFCKQRSDRSLPPSQEALMRCHFFFCTSCSIFMAAMFFGSTLSRVFRSSTQALMSCRNDNKNLV